MTQVKSFADLSQLEVERILAIVDNLNDVEVRIETGDMKLHVRKFGVASSALYSHSPAAVAASADSVSLTTRKSLPADEVKTATLSPVPVAFKEGLIEVRAPMLGRFFRASSPSEPPYVEIGLKVGPEDTVCMLEVMKLFSTVKAGVSGTIIEVLVENGVMVEHDTLLFLVRPE